MNAYFNANLFLENLKNCATKVHQFMAAHFFQIWGSKIVEIRSANTFLAYFFKSYLRMNEFDLF